MIDKVAARHEEARLSRRYLSALGLIVGLAPAMAHAQTNIDEGKTPAQIFASDCNACHKSPKGLAQGRNAGGIADFLRQHYTASREQAGSLAAYILGAGGAGDGRKPAVERASKPSEEPAKPSSKQARRPPKGEEPPGRAAKLQQPKSEEEEEPTPPSDIPTSVEEPASKPGEKEKPAARGRRGEPKPTATSKRGRHAASPEPPPREAPAVTAVAPAPAEPAPQAPAPAAAAPSAEPGETVPRDNIPD
jgi:hypothetical protein